MEEQDPVVTVPQQDPEALPQPPAPAPKSFIQKLLSKKAFWVILAVGGILGTFLAAALATVIAVSVANKGREETPVSNEGPVSETVAQSTEPTSVPPSPDVPPDEVGGEGLMLEYIGSVHGIEEYGEEYYRHIWVLSNPTNQALPFLLELEVYDSEGVLYSVDRYGLCGYHISRDDVEGWTGNDIFPMFLPPGESLVVFPRGSSLNLANQEAGWTLRGTVQTLTDCSYPNFLPRYDPSVRLVEATFLGEPQPGRGKFRVVVENSGLGMGSGVLYVNAYDDDGAPLYGMVVLNIFYNVDGIPPGGRFEEIVLVRAGDDVDLEAATYEFVWLGLSR